MKTEQEIKERLEYTKGYKDALYNCENNMCINIGEDIERLEGQVKALEWVLEDNNGNK